MAITAEQLTSVRLFSECTKEEITALEALLVDQTYHAGRTVYSAGEPSENLYIIARGNVVITHELDEEIVTLAQLPSGYFFGEAGLLAGQTVHQSEAKTTEDKTIILKLGKESFNALSKDHPHLALKIIREIASVLSERLTEDTTRIAIISAISRLINDSDHLNNLKSLSKEILAITLTAVPAYQGFLGLYGRHDGESLSIMASAGISPKELPQQLPLSSDPYLSKLHTEDGELVITAEQYQQADKVFYAKRNLLGRAITIEGKNVGILLVADKTKGDFTIQNSLMLAIIASQISFALEESRLRQERQSREELNRTYVGM